MTIPIYKQEQHLSKLITAQSSVSFVSKCEPYNDSGFSQASIGDNSNYLVKSILVSSNWNFNSDAFLRDELISSINTPLNKPCNLEHNDNFIVGHMTASKLLDDKHNPIEITTPIEQMSDLIHIQTSSVIYTRFKSKELESRASTLIKQIENKTKYISMECYFSDFSYGLKDDNGDCFIVERNESTAFLTRHIKQYGGTGRCQGNKSIGRVLLNMEFSGCAYVDRPANKFSIILN